MSKGKEKINWKFVFAVAIPVSIVASIMLSIIFYIISYDSSALKEYEERIQKRELIRKSNEQFISVCGKILTAADVKNLINVIRANNLVAEHERKGLGYIYVTLNGQEYNLEEVSGLIKQSKKYRINIPNDSSIREMTFLNSNKFIIGDRELGAAYYFNGYLRAISIEEVTNENQ